ncbi:MAG: hypothetical protein HYX84_06695 [Chloroflexi bacterium]|nr:hypothetical protein [Chloroflexota bacterium]
MKMIFGRRGIMVGIAAVLAGIFLLTSCGVNKAEVASKDQEIASLRSQLGAAQLDAKYWTQLTSIFKPVELPSMRDHKAFMTPDGVLLALHFDNTDLSKAQNLNWVAIGIPGKYTREDQERIEKQFGKGFTHFHDLMADTHGGQPGADGVWLMHIAVREFNAPWGAVQPGVDGRFMPTQPPN